MDSLVTVRVSHEGGRSMFYILSVLSVLWLLLVVVFVSLGTLLFVSEVN